MARPFTLQNGTPAEIMEHMYDIEVEGRPVIHVTGSTVLDPGYPELKLIAACERQMSYWRALQAQAMARFAKARTRKDGGLEKYVAEEIGLAVGWTSAYAGARLATALDLVERLPGTLAALQDGQIDARRAEKLADVTRPLSPENARAVEDAVLPQAAELNS